MRTVVKAVINHPPTKNADDTDGAELLDKNNEVEGRGSSKKPEIPSHYPELKPMLVSWKKRSLECEQR
jgi:hypothetical protein